MINVKTNINLLNFLRVRQNGVGLRSQEINPRIISGYCTMLVVINIFLKSCGVQVKEFSIIEPLSYLVVLTLAFICFREKLTWRKAMAIAVIIIDIIIMGVKDNYLFEFVTYL